MKNPPALHEVFRIEPFERFGDENAVLADQFTVEIDFAAAHFFGLDQHQIPVDGGFVAIVALVIARAGV